LNLDLPLEPVKGSSGYRSNKDAARFKAGRFYLSLSPWTLGEVDDHAAIDGGPRSYRDDSSSRSQRTGSRKVWNDMEPTRGCDLESTVHRGQGAAASATI
jgi:hypothetical protein